MTVSNFGGLNGIYLTINDSCMIDEVTAAACMHNIALLS